MPARDRYCPAHLEHPSVKVADRLQDTPCAQVSLRLERACDEEVYDDRVREVLPVAPSQRGQSLRDGLCASYNGAHLACDSGGRVKLLPPDELRRGKYLESAQNQRPQQKGNE